MAGTPNDTEIIRFLEENNALVLDRPSDQQPWPSVTDDDLLSPVDYDVMFPTNSRENSNLNDNLDDDLLIENVPGELLDLAGDLFFNQGGRNTITTLPEPLTASEDNSIFDVLAWYQPIHFYGADWGIFVKQEAIVGIAEMISTYYRASRRKLGSRATNDPHALTHRRIAAALERAAFYLLFLHEHYHHKTESFSIRLHVVENADRFLGYDSNVYQPSIGTSDQIEEALANADAYRRLGENTYKRNLGPIIFDATREFAKDMFSISPPGYKEALNYLKGKDFQSGEFLLQERVQQMSLIGGPGSFDWNIAPQMMRSLFSVKSNIWEIVPPTRRPITGGSVTPLARPSTRQVEKLLKDKGYIHETGRGKGSHKFFTKTGKAPVCLPDARERLTFQVLKQVADTLGFSNLHTLISAISSA